MMFQPTRLASVMAVALLAGAWQTPVRAQTPAGDDVTVELIQMLVESGVLKQEQASALLQRARARAAQTAQTQTAADTGAVAAQPGDVRVPYVPMTVRKEIEKNVKEEMLAQAKAENWAQPNTFPDWVSRITLEGDVRVRNESRLYDSRNSNEIIDFAAFNRDGPVPTIVGNQANPYDFKYLNTRKDRRNLWRYRARLGVNAQVSDNWRSGIRLASGSDNNPVSTSDTFGDGMSKKDIWLDRAWISWQAAPWAKLTAGRAASPFVASDMLFADDLQFDGISAQLAQASNNGALNLFGNLGMYALDYSHNPWRADSGNEGESENKWLMGAQAGAKWQLNEDNALTGALAYYRFDNMEGQRSSACTVYSAADSCDSDWSRPAFMQKGNTLFLLRDIRQWSSDPANWNEWQYVGLASKFDLLDLNLAWDTALFDGLDLRLDGNYIRNLAYDKDEMIGRAGGINNIVTNAEGSPQSGTSDVKSGPNAWMLQATFGRGIALAQQGDWRLFTGYKYIQPDALPDGFNDSSFHQGGTNARGYYLGAAYAFDKHLWGQASWSSAREVYGAPLTIDMIRFDLNAQF